MTRFLLLPLLFASGVFGQSVNCVDALGTPVPVLNARINDIGQATIYQGRPVILFNEAYASTMPDDVVTFFLYHECGHHALGHVIGAGYVFTNEQAADCWAARTLVSSGQFDADDIRNVQAAIAQLGRGDWTHLPGPMRAMNLIGCLGGLGPPGKKDDDDDDDSDDAPKPVRMTCSVTKQEVEDADVSDDYSDALEYTGARLDRAIARARKELRDDVAKCGDDLDSLRDDPKDDSLKSDVEDDRDKIAEMTATVKALEDRRDDQ